MTLCQHGVQTGTGYECSSCVTTPPRGMCPGMPMPVGDTVPRCGFFAAHLPHPLGEPAELRGLDAASAALDEVLKLIGPPPGWRPTNPAAVLADVAALRRNVKTLGEEYAPLTAMGMTARLDRIEQYLRSEQR